MCQTVGLDAQRGQRAHAAHAEHDFLLDAASCGRRRTGGARCRGRARCSPAGRCRAGRASTWPMRACHTFTCSCAAGERDLDLQLGAVLAAHRLDRQVLEIRVEVLGALVALAVDRLHEVALPVEQADGRRTAAGSRSPPCSGRRRGCRGRRNRSAGSRGSRTRRRSRRPGRRAGSRRRSAERRLGVVGVERGEHAVEAVEERRVGGRVEQALLVDALEQRLRDCARPRPTARGAAARTARASGGPSCTRGCAASSSSRARRLGMRGLTSRKKRVPGGMTWTHDGLICSLTTFRVRVLEDR